MAIRQALVALAADSQAKTILDLYGDGESARLFAHGVSDAAVVSAEKDSKLWARLMTDAQLNKFGYHLGDVRGAPGTYDFIWLDLMGQISIELRQMLQDVKRKLNPDGTLVLTLMPSREPEPLFTGEERLRFAPAWIQSVTGLTVQLFFPYRRSRGQWMWLLALREGTNWWTDAREHAYEPTHFDAVKECLDREGLWYGFSWPGSYRQASFRCLDILESYLADIGHPWHAPQLSRKKKAANGGQSALAS